MKGQDLKHRINGARETVKITKAMQLVSASKMSRAEKVLEKSGDFFAYMFEIAKRVGKVSSPFCKQKEVNKTAFIVIAGDKGLCGDYNHKVLDYATEQMEKASNPTVYPIGQFAREHFNKRKIKVNNKYLHLMQSALPEEIRDMVYDLAECFVSGDMDEIYLVFTLVRGKSVSKAMPCMVKLFPLDLPEQISEEGFLEYKKDEDGILKQYIWAYIEFALSSAEYALCYKSMTAMQQATSNGEELVNELQIKYNHIRQEKITNELMDACAFGESDKDRN